MPSGYGAVLWAPGGGPPSGMWPLPGCFQVQSGGCRSLAWRYRRLKVCPHLKTLGNKMLQNPIFLQSFIQCCIAHVLFCLMSICGLLGTTPSNAGNLRLCSKVNAESLCTVCGVQIQLFLYSSVLAATRGRGA